MNYLNTHVDGESKVKVGCQTTPGSNNGGLEGSVMRHSAQHMKPPLIMAESGRKRLMILDSRSRFGAKMDGYWPRRQWPSGQARPTAPCLIGWVKTIPLDQTWNIPWEPWIDKFLFPNVEFVLIMNNHKYGSACNQNGCWSLGGVYFTIFEGICFVRWK